MERQTPITPTPAVPADNPFRQATRVVLEINRKAFEELKDR